MCDTFVFFDTAENAVIFGKNSDREANEAQALEHHPAMEHSRGAMLDTTYMRIPQATRTNAVVLCRPFWMWGAEMGVNDKGVVAGNEAVFTAMPLNRKSGLTGMDLLRLALERADHAAGAMEVIIGLLNDYGQGGVCGYHDRRMAYHNSFILADPAEAWILETAGPIWAAKKVSGHYAISNALTIGEEFDAAHPEVITAAHQAGKRKPGQDFHFARAYSDRFFTFFSAARKRRARAEERLKTLKDRSLRSAIGLLRDHGGFDYRPDSHFLGDRICAHAANGLTRNATQTTGSLAVHLTPGGQFCWATGTSAPCLSIFKPFSVETGLSGTGPEPGPVFNPESMWWEHERLHRAVLADFSARSAEFIEERDALEDRFLKNTYLDRQPVSEISAAAFRDSRAAVREWTERIIKRPVHSPGRAGYRRYWEKLSRRAHMPI